MLKEDPHLFKSAKLLGLTLLMLFALISSGTTGSGDATIRYRMAQSLVARGDVSLDEPASVTRTGRNGRQYAVYGVGQPLIFAAPEALTRLVCYMTGGDFGKAIWEDVSIAISSLFLLPLISAVGIVFLFLTLVEMGFDQRISVAAAMLVACGSLILPYAKFHQEENQIMAIIFASVYFAVRFFNRGGMRDALAASVLCWLPMWFRVSAVAETLPLAVLITALAVKRADREAIKRVIFVLVVAGAITGLWLMFYNWHRFGSVTDTGYLAIYERRGDFEANLAMGLAGPLIHPSKSLIVYSPLLVLAVAGAIIASKEYLGRVLAIASVAILALSIIIPAGSRSWGGDTSWGPRYQVAGHAMLLLFVAYLWKRRPEFSRFSRAAIISIAVWAVGAQAMGIVFNFNLEYNRSLIHTWNQRTVVQWYDLSEAQIPLRADSLWRFGDVWTRSPREPQDAVEEYSIPAFLPWKLGQHFGPRVWLAAVSIWLAGGVLWVALCRRFLKYASRSSEVEAVKR